MKTIFTVAAFSFGLTLSAHAVEPMAPVQQQNFLCAPGNVGVSRVSATEANSKCCSPRTHCVEYLSNTILDHASKANHT